MKQDKVSTTLYIRDFPRSLQIKLRQIALGKDTSLRDEVIEAVKAYTANVKAIPTYSDDEADEQEQEEKELKQSTRKRLPAGK